jgi:glutathione synthase/RimK-type ligase-like ATP-grasp enzyme
MEKSVLIASATRDEPSYGPVSEILERKGYPVIVYKTDKLLAGEDQFTIDLTNASEPYITYNDTSISPEDIGAAWFRKVASFSISDGEDQLSKQLHMNNEVRSLHGTIWPLFYPEDVWLNSPDRMAHADRKLGQLILAKEVGFTVPETVISSDWDSISEKLQVDDEESRIIVKMMRGVISDNNQLKAMHATILDKEKIENLSAYTSPFPGLYQPYAEKAREWRVTVVGDNIFPAAIYTEASAKDDWRKHQLTEAVKFEEDTLPVGIDQLCLEYLGKMGLRYGAFDLVEKPDGEIVFLECNPNGEYFWLEEALEQPISEAIAAELMTIVKNRNRI